ncbi:MAG: hypothetical protein BRD40_03805 [Bacteroidetes bacterium QS_1_65_9]|nr:MAG: hypothetical protein BRD40_03805 [Bacteroidetes bacterium QS_1_65_9]
MSRRLLAAALVLVLLGASAGAAPATAQEESSYERIDETRSTVAYFFHARPGVPTIQVSVWGTVPQPGIYEVGERTSLDRLMTMAGGAPIQARSENEQTTITIRLFREQAQGGRELMYKAPLRDLLRDTEAYPSLQNGDVLVVKTQVESGFGWRDVLSIVSSVGSLALVIERLFFR